MLVLKSDEGDRAFSRSSARMLDLATYNTGKPCIWAHTADRYTSTGACTECVKLKGKEIGDLKKQREDYSASHQVTKEQAKDWNIAFYNVGTELPCGHLAQQLVVNDRCRLCLRQERNNKQALDLLK